MCKKLGFIGLIGWMICCFAACKGDVANTGVSVLDSNDAIVVLTDTFPLLSHVDSCNAIISQADSFLLGEIETDYGVLRASILTQLACPEGYSYPADFHIDSIDSICLFIYYASWVGDANSPMAVNAYLMDKKTFEYSGIYRSDLNIDDYCSRDSSILTNRRIVVASEKLDSIKNSNGVYMPMVRMRVNDDFMQYFGSITSFKTQEAFNKQFKGLLLETSFGSSTVLNISDIALGVYYRFGYNKAGRDTVVHDMKAFYANSEVRTVNHLLYRDKKEWIEKLQSDSDTYNYIISPAGAYTCMSFPMMKIADTIISSLVYDSAWNKAHDSVVYTYKRPYVNKAEVRVMVENEEDDYGRDAWLKPNTHMLLIKEKSMERFFKNKELPSDTCALVGQLAQGTDSLGNNIYYYSYDLSALLTNQLRQQSNDTTLNMLLVPVALTTTTTSSSSTTISAVRQEQTISATKIRSAQNGMKLELVYSGF